MEKKLPWESCLNKDNIFRIKSKFIKWNKIKLLFKFFRVNSDPRENSVDYKLYKSCSLTLIISMAATQFVEKQTEHQLWKQTIWIWWLIKKAQVMNIFFSLNRSFCVFVFYKNPSSAPSGAFTFNTKHAFFGERCFLCELSSLNLSFFYKPHCVPLLTKTKYFWLIKKLFYRH